MLYIHGVGHFHPENILDNQFLEDLDIDTNDQWIMERVGIKTRRTVLDLDYIKKTKNADVRGAKEASQYSNIETGKFAAEKALQRANLRRENIGMVIAGGCSPEYATPADACVLAGEMGLSAKSFDLNSACSSFAAQIYFLSMMRPEALPDFILLVSPENNTRTVDYRDRRTAVLWGDGTSAVIVSPRIPSRAQVVFTTLTSDPSGWKKVLIPGMGHFTQDGPAVQAFAIKRTVKCYREVEEKHEDPNNKLFFISHQANLRMLESVCRRCEIPEDRHFYNVNEFGNTGASGAPTVLSQNWDRFSPGDKLAFGDRRSRTDLVEYAD